MTAGSSNRNSGRNVLRFSFFVFAKYLGFESPDRRALCPRVGGQAGLPARLREERRRIPLPLSRDLRQEQSSPAAACDEQPVPSDLDIGGTADRLERAQQRQLDIDVRQFVRADWREPRVL